MGPWVLFETQKIPVYLFSDVGIELAELSLRGGSELNPVRQRLVPQLPHQFAEGNRALLFRFLQ